MIRFKKCSKLFGQSLALNSISLEISGPGLVLVLGSNGAGKSTFLKACAGLLTPSFGSMECKDPVSYLGHQSMLYPQLTVAENLNFFSSVQSFSSVDSAAAWLEIESISDKFVAALSQGQKARVGLARALQGADGKALLLDEPSAAFDRYWQQIFIDKLKEFSLNRLVIMITHDPERYINFASRAIILAQGSVYCDLILDSDSARQTALLAFNEVLR